MMVGLLLGARRYCSMLLLSMLLLCGLGVILGVPRLVLAHSLTEVLRQPSAFDQQVITVTGQVAKMTTRYGETVSTTFELVGPRGASVAVLVSGEPQCRQGQICRMSGLFVAQKNLLLPEKIERVAERPFVSAGVLFHQRRSESPIIGGESFRDIYIPE